MSSFLRQLGSRLQTSSSARYVLYGVAAAGTTAVTWRYHAQSRNEQLQRRNAARAAHAHTKHDIVSPVKEDKQLDREAPTPATADGDGEVEEEAGNTGAFDPVTGEINWDCPCLGGMAHGPCGPQFRLAFSCFVYSEAEPKGMDCVEKFKDMQECFRDHPDIYAEELADDGEEDDNEGPVSSTTPPPETPPASGGVVIEIPRPDGESKPKPVDDDLKLPGGAPPPIPQPKPPISPPPLPPADPKPPTISDPPAGPIPPPTIIDPPAGPVRGGIATTRQRNPTRSQTPRE